MGQMGISSMASGSAGSSRLRSRAPGGLRHGAPRRSGDRGRLRSLCALVELVSGAVLRGAGRGAPRSRAFSTARGVPALAPRAPGFGDAAGTRRPGRRTNRAAWSSAEAAKPGRAETTSAVAVTSSAPARFSESTREVASARPSVPPIRTVPPNSRNGRKESAALAASDNSTAPAILTAPASIARSGSISRPARRSAAGNRNADAPNTCKTEVGQVCARIADEVEGARSGGRVPGRILDMVRNQAQQRHQSQRTSSRNPVTSFSLLCWVGDRSFITLAGG